MLKKSFNFLFIIWFVGLLVMLLLVFILVLLVWVVSLLNCFVGLFSLIGCGFVVIGQLFVGDLLLVYLFGIVLLLVVIYLFGFGVQLGLKWLLVNLFDLILWCILLIGNLYNLVDCFVGLLDKKQDVDIVVMSLVWCFFGGDGVVVLVLMFNFEVVELDGCVYYVILVLIVLILVGGGLFYVLVEWVKLVQIGMDIFISIYVLMGIILLLLLVVVKVLVELCGEQLLVVLQVVLCVWEWGVY